MCIVMSQVVTIRDALYDLEAFVGFRDPEIECVHVPDMEIQQIAKRTLAARPDRINMEQVRIHPVSLVFFQDSTF